MADETKKQTEQEPQDTETPMPADEAEFDAGWDDVPESAGDEPSADTEPENEEAREDEDAAPSEENASADGESDKKAEQVPEAEDGEGADTEQKQEDSAERIDPEEYRRLKASEASMKGRLNKLQKEFAELQLQAQQKEKSKQESRGSVEIDEDIKDLADDFTKKFPHLVDLLKENSDEGTRIREALEEGGAYTAYVLAENIHQKREAETRQYVDRQAAERQHYSELANQHPEFAEYILGDQDKASVLIDSMQRWISETMTYAEGHAAMRILKEGSTEEVSNLLGRFKQALQDVEKKNKQGEVNQRRKERHAEDFAAVPTRRQPPKTPPAPRDDFDAAWEEAMRS